MSTEADYRAALAFIFGDKFELGEDNEGQMIVYTGVYPGRKAEDIWVIYNPMTNCWYQDTDE